MTRLRLLLVVAGAGTLLAGLPAQAAVRTHPEPLPSGAEAGETRALEVLSGASRAARARSYSGTQYVSTWRADVAASSVAEVSHTTADGFVVQVLPTAGGAVDRTVTPVTDLDPRLLRLLGEHYVLSLAADDTWVGRPVHVVEARHPGDGQVSGRFWVDTASLLVVRRELFDRSGRLVRSSAFATLDLGGIGADVATAGLGSDQLDAAALEALRRDAWQIPSTLGTDLDLYDARMRTHDGEQVLHVSYSDGLSALSLFVQRGRLGEARMPGFRKQRLGDSAVWVRPSSPERVVWGGDGRVFTMLTDAPPEATRAALAVLPHDKAPRTGVIARIGRGLARLASWLNPFD